MRVSPDPGSSGAVSLVVREEGGKRGVNLRCQISLTTFTTGLSIMWACSRCKVGGIGTGVYYYWIYYGGFN